jgi:uncharacterized protein DUF6519
MRGDFSRLTFDPRKRYTAVLMQQGRVPLDSDWNEQAAILEHFDRRRFEDVVGAFAVPAGVGFEVHLDANGVLALSAGRVYAGGLLCELDAETPIAQVARRRLTPDAGRTDLVYLDAWERVLTALDDPDLLDPALGGADTAVRLKVAWTIDFVEDVGARSCAEATAALPRQGLGRLTAVAPAGYLGTENQLYRVEIHNEGSLGRATFKWSRDNASTVLPVKRFVDGTTLVVAVSLRGSATVAVGDWFEISGDEREQRGLVGTLARVERWSPDDREIVFDHDVSMHANETRPRAVRWDQTEAATISVEPGPIVLENGIELRFAGTSFRAGDYWTIPARATSTDIDWPTDAPPQGIEHQLCPLALLTWDQSGKSLPSGSHDCRPAASSLAELSAELRLLRAEVATLANRIPH